MVMIDVDLDAGRLRIHFTRMERLVGLVQDLDAPIADVRSVQRLRDPWTAVRGHSLGLRGMWMLGTANHQLVALRCDQEAVLIRMRSGVFQELLVSTPHPDLVVDRLVRGGVRGGRLVAV